MADLPNVGDMCRVAHECCSERSALNMIGRVERIESDETGCDCCGSTIAGLCAYVPDLKFANDDAESEYGWWPLAWLRRIPPLAELESIHIADELDRESGRKERVPA